MKLLFRRKEILYGDLVKYSHKTALENPQMILREYEHKIQKFNDESRELEKNKTKYSFEVSWVDTDFNPRSHLRLIASDDYLYSLSLMRYYYQGEIHFDKKKIMKFVNVEPTALLQAVNKNADIGRKLVKINKDVMTLQKEKDKFVKTYKVK